jgi:hypothetical protein
VYTGTGFISEFSEQFGKDTVGKFKGAIGIYGSYTTVIT